MLLLLDRRHRAAALLLALAVALLWWAPFLLADHLTLQALGGIALPVSRDSVPGHLGASGWSPVWFRPAQLGVATLAGVVVVRLRRPELLLLVVLVLRVVLDVQAWPYYLAGPALGALLLDLGRPGRRPWSSMALAAAGLPLVLDVSDGAGPVRLSALLLACAALMGELRASVAMSRSRVLKAVRVPAESAGVITSHGRAMPRRSPAER